MGAFDDEYLTGRTGGRRTSRPRSAPLAAALLTLLVSCILFAAVAPAGAVTAPGRPTAKTPKGAINTTRPTFKWSKAARAAKYEVRVYKGRTLKLKKTGITRLSWKSSKTLPRGVSLTWKVRARNAGGNGAWSKRLTFKVRRNRKAITAFSFQGLSPPVIGVVTEAAHTIVLTVPFGTNVSALVATFATTGASVAAGATPQTSGLTSNNFTSPVTYRVTAANGTTQPYTVTVTVAAAVIGQSYGGGKIAYILQSGDLGYSTLVTHGLIAAATDQSAGIVWAIPAYQSTLVPGGTLTAIGTGSANTDKIIAQNGTGSTYAAGLARAYRGGGHSDWYLPSKDELHNLYLNRAAIGSFFASNDFWSSSEYDVSNAWDHAFDDGGQYFMSKYYTFRVRAVRAF